MTGGSSAAQGSKPRRAITVVVVDDEPLIRGALAKALLDAGLELVGEAAEGHAAIEIVLRVRPDVVLMDLRLPDIPGVEAIECLARLAPASRVLVLTRSEQNRVIEAIVAGASGYILKSATPEAIAEAVQATAAGEAVLSSRVAGKLLERIRERESLVPAGCRHDASTIRAALTARELEIFQCLASGHRDQEIAAELSLSTSTVSNHIASILTKLDLHNRTEAAVQAVRSGIS